MHNPRITFAVVSAALVFAMYGCAAEDEAGSVSQATISYGGGAGGGDGGGGEIRDAGAGGGDGGAGCVLTQGFWKNHEEDWPISSLMLGSVTYTQAQLLAILRTPVRGNGLLSLAHQLIAAKLNIASGASPASISATIAAADALIGSQVIGGGGFLSPPVTSALTAALDAFNNGITGPAHCDNGPPTPALVCGDGIVNGTEECDDGNTLSYDGCSGTCRIEVCPPPEPWW